MLGVEQTRWVTVNSPVCAWSAMAGHSNEGVWEHLRQGAVVDPAVDCFDGAGRDEGAGRDGGVRVAVRAARRQPAAVSSGGPPAARAPELTVVASSP